MIKPKTVFIWMGPEGVSITRGLAPESSKKHLHCKDITYKHRGVLSQFETALNVDEMYCGEYKKLKVKGKIVEGWQVCIISRDLDTGEAFIPDVSPSIVSQIKGLRNEVAALRLQNSDLKDMLRDTEGRDRFRQKVNDVFKFVGQAKGKLFQQQEGYGLGSPFTSRWLNPPSSGTDTGGGSD